MTISRYPFLYIIFFLILIWTGCKSESPENDQQNNVVTKYDGDHVVTTNELNKYVEDWLYYKKFKKRSDVYNNALNDLLVNQFKRMDFFEKGLDKNKKLIQHISRIINEELISEYFEKEYIDKYANEDNAKKIYRIMDKQVIAQQIVLFKPKNASPTQIDNIKQKAMKIKSEVDQGKNFDSLVIKYSQDKESIKNNGYMPPVEWKQSILDPLGNIIFRLNKNDVRVLNDDDAFRIIKIAEINKIHIEPFEKIKNEIISDLKNVYYQTSFDEYEKDKKGLIDENNLKWNENALKQLVKWSQEPNFYKNKYKETFKNAVESNNKTILIFSSGDSNDKRKVDYKEYLRLLNNILILPPYKNDISEDGLKKFILEAIQTDIIVKKADSLNLKKNIFNPFTKNLTLKNQLAYLYNQAEIEAKIPDTTDTALHQFYQENKNTLYYQLEKRNIFVMVFPNKEEAENALNKIKHGVPFEKVRGSYLVKTYIKDHDGKIKSFRIDEKPVFGNAAFKLKESEVSGPIQFQNDNHKTQYAIIKCYHIRPEKQLTFNDVKNSITEDFKNYYRKKIEKEVEERLKSKYHPVINEEVLAKVISPN